VTRRLVADRLGIGLAWLCGGVLVAVSCGIVGWLAVKGAGALSWDFLWKDPAPGSALEGVTGGVRGPIVGTVALTTLGCVIALPLGVGTAVFLAEYGRPVWLARTVESAIDVLFGVPAIVFALFGLAVFSNPLFIPLSSEVESSGQAFGRSFVVAGIMMSLLALPPITRSTQSAILSIPEDLREASLALGKSKLATTLRVVVPGASRGVTTGVILGAGRVVGDTAIVWLLLGGVITPEVTNYLNPANWLEALRGTGATLTSYVYYASPVGEGNSPDRAYGAAFVLIVLMLLINAVLLLITRRAAWKR
jgi:phosphate transport system permease protein